MKKLFFSILFLATLANLLLASTDSTSAFYLKIDGEINLGLPNYIQRIVTEANQNESRAVILEINTPGGRVDAALQIRDAIFESEIPVIAFINREAASAGALISLSCDSIYMAPGSSIGAVTPVDQSGKKSSEKMVSYLRSVMRSIAQRNNRPVEVVEAMVDEDIEIPEISEKGKLLTLTGKEAVKLKIADGLVNSLDEILEKYNIDKDKFVRTKISWSEKLVFFLTNSIISSLLLSIGIFGLIFEVRTPGWGIGGTIAVIALALFFGVHYLVNLAQWTEILLFIIGAGLILLEIFVIPGFGITGIAGMICVLASFVLSLVGHLDRIGSDEILIAMSHVGLSLIFAFIITIPVFLLLPRTKPFKSLILDANESTKEGFRSTPSEYENYLNAEGIAISTLRPSGIGLFNGERLNVIAEGEFIDPDEKIKVIKVEGYNIIVRKIA